MPRSKMLLRGLAFFLALAVAVCCTSWFLGIGKFRAHKIWSGLQKEKKGSMDAVIIGASNVVEFWQPMFGWADHGIAVWTLSIPGLTCAAIKYMMIEARKTQPDALYIVSLSTFKASRLRLEFSPLHHVLDYMPISANRLAMTHDLVSRSEYRGLDRLEYYLPIIRFHSRWDELEPWIFGVDNNATRLSFANHSFGQGVHDITDELVLDNDVREPIPGDIGAVFGELLDYCDAEHVNVLFVKSPQVDSLKEQGRMNALEDVLEARGYPCLDLLEDFHKTGFDPRVDFHNKGHTNIHGSLKFSKAVGDYLVEHYGFEDKRGLEGWESWEKGYKAYMAYCAIYTLPFEREHSPRFISDIPALSKPSVTGQSIRVTWKGVEGAEGYAVFRKANKAAAGKRWEWVADLDPDRNEYTDDDLKPSVEYTYTVAPYRQTGGTREYGSFDVLGVNAVTKGEKA